MEYYDENVYYPEWDELNPEEIYVPPPDWSYPSEDESTRYAPSDLSEFEDRSPYYTEDMVYPSVDESTRFAPTRFGGQEYNTPLIAGYGGRTAILQPGQSPTDEWGTPVSGEYVKGIESDIGGAGYYGGQEQTLRKPSEQQLSIFDRWQEFKKFITPKIESEADSRASEARSSFNRSYDYADRALLTPAQRSTVDSRAAEIYASTYKAIYDHELTRYQQVFDKNVQSEEEQRKHQRNVLEGTSAKWEIRQNPETGFLERINAATGERSSTGIPLRRSGEIPEIGQIGTTPPGVKNEAALEGLSAGQAAIVKGLTEYTIPLPSGMALRNPEWQAMLGRAALYDTSFDAAQYPVRLSVMRDFKSGNASKNIRSLNTAIQHLDTLSKAGESLENADIKLWNTIANTALNQIGDPRVVKFTTAADAVAGELATVFKSTSGTDQEIKEWRRNLNSSASPEQIKEGAIDTAIELLGGRLAALTSQYEKGVGKPKDFSLLSDKARGILQELGADVDKIDPVSTRGERDEAAPVSRTEERIVGGPMMSMPNASQYKGRTIVSNKGERFISNGSKWVRK